MTNDTLHFSSIATKGVIHCDAHHPVIAAIDLGTNSCRLLVATVNVAGLHKTFFRRRPNPTAWRIIDSFAKVVRLGEGLQKTGVLSLDAIERSLDALSICKKKMDLHGVGRMRAVATEACRRATNGQLLVDRVTQELGFSIDIIQSEEEARLALTGCAAVLNPGIPYAIVFDIGGGSTEAVWLKINAQERRRPGYPVPFEVLDSISIPYGVVTMSESYAQHTSTQEIYARIRSHVGQALEPFVVRNNISQYISKGNVQLIGSSGTITTLVAVKMGLPRYERRLIDGVSIGNNELHEISQKILSMSQADRVQHPCIGGGRADLVLIGSAILEGICDVIHVPEVRVADRGVREGILSELLLTLQKGRY